MMTVGASTSFRFSISGGGGAGALDGACAGCCAKTQTGAVTVAMPAIPAIHRTADGRILDSFIIFL